MQYIILISTLAALYFIGKFLMKGLQKVCEYRNSHRISSDFVFMKICTPKKETREDKEIDRESRGQDADFKGHVALMSQLINSLSTMYSGKYRKKFSGQDYLSFEIAVVKGMINLYIVAPAKLCKLVEKKITAFFPDSFIDYSAPYNIMEDKSVVKAEALFLKKDSNFPLQTFKSQTNDPFNFISNSIYTSLIRCI